MAQKDLKAQLDQQDPLVPLEILDYLAEMANRERWVLLVYQELLEKLV